MTEPEIPLTVVLDPLTVWARTDRTVTRLTDPINTDTPKRDLRVLRALLETALEHVDQALGKTSTAPNGSTDKPATDGRPDYSAAVGSTAQTGFQAARYGRIGDVMCTPNVSPLSDTNPSERVTHQ